MHSSLVDIVWQKRGVERIFAFLLLSPVYLFKYQWPFEKKKRIASDCVKKVNEICSMERGEVSMELMVKKRSEQKKIMR